MPRTKCRTPKDPQAPLQEAVSAAPCRSRHGTRWVREGATAQLLILSALLLAPLLSACARETVPAAAPAAPGIAPELVADYLHEVIQADRTTYARQVVERLQDQEGVIKASEHFREEKALPLPAQMLRMAAQLVAQPATPGKPPGFHYALISNWAINKANLPKTDFERRGLATVVAHRERPATGYEVVGGRRLFIALYADVAVSPACINCHNRHPESPRHDFAPGDVMGGVVIALPVGG